MDEVKDSVKIAYTKNLDKINFNTTISAPIDNNVNIKNILDVQCYLFDLSNNLSAGKMIVTGKLGIKVLYIDTDNITNIITETQGFSEQLIDDSISSDSIINISSYNIVPSIVSKEGTLKVSCDVTLCPVMYLKLPMRSAMCEDNMLTKKEDLNVISLSSELNTSFNYTTNIETKDEISKILFYNSRFVPSQVEAKDGSVVVEGKLYSQLFYETNKDGNLFLKEITDSIHIKSEFEANSVTSENELELNFTIDPSKENITTETDDDGYVVTISHHIHVNGVVLKKVTLEILDDVYSIDNDLEISKSSRELICNLEKNTVTDSIFGETVLTDSEPAIDEIVSVINPSSEITNFYIKDNFLIFEGIISSRVIYIDENKNFSSKEVETPFILNSKIQMETMPCVHSKVNIINYKCRAKRGTIIEVEFSVQFSVCSYVSTSKEIIDTIKIGKPLDFSNYDYQIFLARPNETMWDLGKRIKVSVDKIMELNKNLPLVMTGTEKIIIKR
ncbi:MAG: LysM peptidoglycan-binding domain-containing protein [Clostridiales bacterium]|nr:LysM peptidoglycan-binding domain-containing protein [Clostridiales bacterium]